MLQMKIFRLFFSVLVLVSFFAISCKRDEVYYQQDAALKNASSVSRLQGAAICIPAKLDQHFITQGYAYEMIRNYQTAVRRGGLCEGFGESGWVFSETFPAAAIQMLLDQRGCCNFRIYNGLDKDNRLHMIMVGVNDKGADILYCNGGGNHLGSDSCYNATELNLIVEMGAPCPEACSGSFVGP